MGQIRQGWHFVATVDFSIKVNKFLTIFECKFDYFGDFSPYEIINRFEDTSYENWPLSSNVSTLTFFLITANVFVSLVINKCFQTQFQLLHPAFFSLGSKLINLKQNWIKSDRTPHALQKLEKLVSFDDFFYLVLILKIGLNISLVLFKTGLANSVIFYEMKCPQFVESQRVKIGRFPNFFIRI